MSDNYPSSADKELIKAFKNLRTETEIQNFLRDLLTIAEIREFSKRFQIAKLLWTTDQSYAQIAQITKTSTTTVTRVAFWLNEVGLNGYKTILKRLYGKK